MSRIPTRTRRSRVALAAALIAVGCSGGSGGGCGSSCGGAFRTQDDQGNPIVYTGARLPNAAQVRITRSGLAFLNAQNLNGIIAQLNGAGGLSIGCIDAGEPLTCSETLFQTEAHIIVGDTNFNGQCDAADQTPIQIQFRDVTWGLDPANNVLRMHLAMHLKTGDIYLRTVERHSSICSSSNGPIQGHVQYNDEVAGLPQMDTAVDLAIRFSTAPDGRLEFNFDDASLTSVVTNLQPGAFLIDGRVTDDATANPVPPATGSTPHDACDLSSNDPATYAVVSGDHLSCHIPDTDCTDSGILCQIATYARGYVLDYLKNAFASQIVKAVRTQLDNVRCQRSHDNANPSVAAACDPTHACPNDDEGNPLDCDASRGVCKPHGDASADPYDCEPISLGVAGQLDVSGLTQTVGFPPGTKLNVFAALGSKGGGAKIDANGLQLAAQAGTQTPSVEFAPCVPSASPPAEIAIPAMDFDDPANKPPTVVGYDFGFSLASAMLNRGFYDAYGAGMLCIAVTNVTSSFISSGLFKTFLPSIGLVTGGKDVPMKILLRPTQPPFVRVGKNTAKQDSNGNLVPDDPLITLTFNQMNLDFYALVDERQVRIFTLQADLSLPLDLRPDANDNSSLQPVLGGLDTVLTNISALSPDYNPDATATNGKPVQLAYTPGSDMLAEDPGVVKDLLGAAVRLAQPLLAGVIKPIALPSVLGLKFEVRAVAGAEQMADLVNGGYQHLAIWAQVAECGSTGVNCERYNVRTQVRVAGKYLPENVAEVLAGARPSITLDLSAQMARSARAQFTYRVDGSLWSPWLSQQRLTITDPLFLVQGHHTIEVAARELGDDRTTDPRPVAVDFFVSYEAPAVTLAERPIDGALITRARSGSTPAARLTYAYRIDGQQGWTEPGPARIYTQDVLNGRGLTVSVTDDAGRSAQAHFGDEEGPVVARAGVSGGCASTGSGTLVLFGLLALLARRQRKGSIPAG